MNRVQYLCFRWPSKDLWIGIGNIADLFHFDVDPDLRPTTGIEVNADQEPILPVPKTTCYIIAKLLSYVDPD